MNLVYEPLLKTRRGRERAFLPVKKSRPPLEKDALFMRPLAYDPLRSFIL